MAVEDHRKAAVELRYRSDRVSLVAGEGFYLQVFHDVPTVEDLDEIEALCRTLPHPYAAISVILQTRSIAITGEARKRTDLLAATTKDWVAVNAMAVLGTGFFAAMVRGIIAAVTFIMSDHPQIVTESVAEAVTFVGKHSEAMARPCPPDALVQAVKEAFALLGMEMPA